MVLDKVMNWTLTVNQTGGGPRDLVTSHNASSLVALPKLNSITATVTGNGGNSGHSEYGLFVYIFALTALAVALLTDPGISFTDLVINIKELLSKLSSRLAKRLSRDRS